MTRRRRQASKPEHDFWTFVWSDGTASTMTDRVLERYRALYGEPGVKVRLATEAEAVACQAEIARCAALCASQNDQGAR